jgi:hypothetical protein
MRQLYYSEYTGISAYLMDFGFGGFLGYGTPERIMEKSLQDGLHRTVILIDFGEIQCVKNRI